MEDLEEVKEHILMYEAYEVAYKCRREIINKKLEPILSSVPICGGNGLDFQIIKSQEYIENKMKYLLSDGELTKEEYDFYKMNFRDYMFKYGTEYL
jgi:hypothetical protein